MLNKVVKSAHNFHPKKNYSQLYSAFSFKLITFNYTAQTTVTNHIINGPNNLLVYMNLSTRQKTFFYILNRDQIHFKLFRFLIPKQTEIIKKSKMKISGNIFVSVQSFTKLLSAMEKFRNLFRVMINSPCLRLYGRRGWCEL